MSIEEPSSILMQKAFDSLDRSDWTAALTYLDIIEKRRAVTESLFLLRATAFLGLGNAERAEKEILRELVWYPLSIAALNFRGIILQITKRRYYEIPEDPPRDLSGQDREQLRVAALEELWLGNPRNAGSILERLREGPSLKNVNLLRARTQLVLGDTSGALEALRCELNDFPDNTDAHYLLFYLVTQRLETIEKKQRQPSHEWPAYVADLPGVARFLEERIRTACVQGSGDSIVVIDTDEMVQRFKDVVSLTSPRRCLVNPEPTSLQDTSVVSFCWSNKALDGATVLDILSRLEPGGVLAFGPAMKDSHITRRIAAHPNIPPILTGESGDVSWLQRL